MPTYITLVRFTQQGAQTIKDAPGRLASARQAMRSMGAEMKAIYYTQGQYDAVAIVEAPDDETVAKVALAIGAVGNVRTETLRAFTEEEFAAIVAGIPG